MKRQNLKFILGTAAEPYETSSRMSSVTVAARAVSGRLWLLMQMLNCMILVRCQVKTSRIVGFDWEHKLYAGNLVTVHRDCVYVAYVLKGECHCSGALFVPP